MQDSLELENAAQRAVILVSGGLDSSTLLGLAHAHGRQIYALSFDYGQRHATELACAKRQAAKFGAQAHEVVDLRAMGRLVSSATALVKGSSLEVPKPDAPLPEPESREIPSTYVPARNTLFLSYALAWAEVLQSSEIWIGANALDYSGYPDCRPEFLQAWEDMAHQATKAAVEGEGIRLVAPLLHATKAQIIQAGAAHGVDYADTLSCYDPRGEEGGRPRACGACESCVLRRAGFEAAGLADPTLYRS